MTRPPSGRQRIVLAFSSGLQSTEAISWLTERHEAEVVTLTLDFGQGRELEALRDQALAAGAVRAHVLDVAEAFANHFLLPALRAGALYSDGRSMTSGLERALLAQKLVEIAGIEQTATVAHGCGSGDPRIAAAVQTLNPTLTVLALPAAVVGSADCQMGPRPMGAGERPSEPASVELTFVRGAPTAINGIAMPLGDLIGSLNMLAGPHGVGRLHPLEPPAPVVLHAAHRSLIADGGANEAEWQSIARAYAEVIDRGEWFAPVRTALNARVESLQASVSGTIGLKFFNGDCEIVDKKPLEGRPPLKMAATKG